LLEDVKLLTRLSDKLQNKVQQQNDELRHAKHNLEDVVKTRTSDLNKAYSDLLNINTELDSFVYRASHDIRGPLATFLGLCNLAKMEATETIALHYFDMLHHTAKRMDEILSRLLAISKLKNLEVSYEDIAIKALIENIIQEAQQKENFRSVKISINRLEDLKVCSDRNVLEIIFMQMLENAVDSLNNSPQERTQTEFIHLYVIRQEEHLCVFIKYTGVIIPPAHWEKVFEIFHRTHHGADMTGLRLYTAKLAADKVNCQIKIIESNQVQTIFELLIPIHAKQEEAK
jgi:signal transduction histidine kinase